MSGARGVKVVGAAAVSGHGLGWRGLGRALLEGARLPSELVLAETDDATPPRVRKLMSRSARLSAIAARQALADARWPAPRADVGFFLGVGASAGEMGELLPVLRATLPGFSLQRLGQEGLAACNPLLTFQLLNNFTMCHAAILEGTEGPNGAFFSRGSGTVVALLEALHALREGTATRVLCGGADCATHPVTAAELRRDGAGRPAEGAALLALAAEAEAPLATVERCVVAGRASSLDETLGPLRGIDLVVLSGPEASHAARGRFAGLSVIDTSLGLGETLAAGPALAWACALDLLVDGTAGRALVLSADPDGGLGVVVLARGA